jgi:deazaflavin-dependent oxidoreductase (nitroreductase family)
MAEDLETVVELPAMSRSTQFALKVLRTRWLVRLPIYLFRARLGFIFGHRLIMLEHFGRKTGKRRYAILELIGQKPGTYFVVSGFGEHADWLRNVRANPRVTVTVGSARGIPAVAKRLEPAAGTVILGDYAERYPRTWQALTPVLKGLSGRRSFALGDVAVVSLTRVDEDRPSRD